MDTKSLDRKVPSFDETFQEALACWTDERHISREQIATLFYFGQHIVNLADDNGWVYDGHSYKEGVPLGTLVIKAHLEDTPVVCFVSGRTFLNCVRVFLRKVDADLCEWRADRFRT